MGASAAAENPLDTNNATMNSIDDTTPVVSENTGGAESLLGASNDGNLLSADTGSFKDLEDYINTNKGYGKTVYLNQDYAFNNETDSDYTTTGIYLGTYVTIDGQGHTIDAQNTKYIFNVIGQDVIIKNIVFKNTNYRAIEVGSPNVEISGCTFDNNTNRAVGTSSAAGNCVLDSCKFYNGGGLYVVGLSNIICNSIFENNTANNGGAINVGSKDVIIDECTFNNNSANYGGAIYFDYDGGILTIKNSVVSNNLANTGGAIYTKNAVYYENEYQSKYNKVDIVASTFAGNTAVNNPEFGALETNAEYQKTYVLDSETTHDNGKYFDEIDNLFKSVSNVAYSDDTVIIDLAENSYYKITHGPITISTNVVVNGHGSTIDANGNQVFSSINNYKMYNIEFNNLIIINGLSDYGTINFNNVGGYVFNNCIFKNNTASENGGAIYSNHPTSIYDQDTGELISGGSLTIDGCGFYNNTAFNGGALTMGNSGSQPVIKNSNFINNTAVNQGGAFYASRGQFKISNCQFINNTANRCGVSYRASSTQLSVSNCIIVNNSAYANPVDVNGLFKGTGNTQENNYLLSSFPDYFTSLSVGKKIVVNTSDYYYDGTITLGSTAHDVDINGNGSTIYGNGNKVFELSGNVHGVNIYNFTFVNCTIGHNGASGVNNCYYNCTFINCTNSVQTRGGKIYDLVFINCTSPYIDNTGSYTNISDITIDDLKYSDECYPIFIKNGNITLNDIKEYEIITPIIIQNDNIVIDGQGSTIKSLTNQTIFYIYGNNVTIKNFKLETGGCAIYKAEKSGTTKYDSTYYNSTYYNIEFNGGSGIDAIGNVTVNHCKFTNNTGKSINIRYSRGDKTYSLINNSKFENNTGRSITFPDMGNGDVDNCTFKNITTTSSGSGIYGTCINSITNSNFTNIKSNGANGGAIYLNSANTTAVINSHFINCSALSGGAIYENDVDGIVNVSKSTFDGSKAKSSGGAIYVKGTLILDDCSLNNNTADSSGAIYSGSGLNITNSSLTNNSAVKGGALVSDGDNAVISGCNVSGNTADVGAGISLSGDNAVIDNVNFTDNTASVRGGALVTTGANTNITNVNATGNSAPSGSAFVLDGDGAKLENSNVTDNKGVNGEGSAVEVNGENIDILDNTIHGNDGAGVLVNGNGTNITGNHFNSTRDISINPNSDIYNNKTLYDKLQNENKPNHDVEILNVVDPTIIVSDVNVQQNTTFNITILNDDFEGNVSVKLDDGSLIYNGTFKDIEEDDGILVGPVLPVAGEKTVTVFFYGDPGFINKTVNTTFIVSRVTPQMNITIANVTYGNNSIVEVRIGNKANGTITITIDDIEITSIPIVNGNATYDLGVLPAGNKTANVQFRYNTSDYYNNNVGNSTIFCVDKAESVISIGVNDTYDIGEDVNITVSTTGSSGNLTFKINDTNYTVVNGTVNITGLPLGKYTITATLDADENYTNKTITKTFTIKKINTDLSS